jgi:uncharacterized protein YoxC
MFDSYLASNELVLFWEGESIDKAMVYSDFQATLDGYVGIPAYAGEEKRAAYVQLNEQLKPFACVLFTIGFDELGYPERSWNLPLRHMAEIAGRGPDLGGGAIRLVCRSQNPVSWHGARLWDPDMQGAYNTFTQITQEVEKACNRFSMIPVRSSLPASTLPPNTDADEDIPVLTAEASVTPTAVSTEASLDWEKERGLLREQLVQQQLRIATLENDKNETIARLGFMHQQQVDILEAQNARLLSQHKTLKTQSDDLREQVDTLRHQVTSIHELESSLSEERRLHEEQLAAVMRSKLGEETQKFEELLQQKEQEYAAREARLRAEHQLSLEQRLGEEANTNRLQMESLRAELNYREDTLTILGRELAELKAGQTLREEAAADEFLRRLEALGMNFVAFHAGAGHISVPVTDLTGYVSDPTAYAAAKCMVSTENYRHWLQHYENPRCNASIGEGKCCDARLIRMDSPTKFVAGQSDRCARHQSADSAIDNVLRFR